MSMLGWGLLSLDLGAEGGCPLLAGTVDKASIWVAGALWPAVHVSFQFYKGSSKIPQRANNQNDLELCSKVGRFIYFNGFYSFKKHFQHGTCSALKFHHVLNGMFNFMKIVINVLISNILYDTTNRCSIWLNKYAVITNTYVHWGSVGLPMVRKF
jgi:hypothetical protein